MTGSSRVAPLPDDADRSAQSSFLSSHRAATVWAREFGLVVDEMLKNVHVHHAQKSPTAPVVRRSPDRCIMQLGPVALTVARLKSTRDLADEGQLLIIVWSGSVAPPPARLPEQIAVPSARRAAVALWEESYAPNATSGDDWRWAPQSKGGELCSSEGLARICVDKLSAAYAEATKGMQPGSPTDNS